MTLRKVTRFVSGEQLALAAVLCLTATPAAARIPMALPGPSVLMYVGIGIVGAILAFRVSRRK